MGTTEESSLLAQAQAHIHWPFFYSLGQTCLGNVPVPSEHGLPTLIPEKEKKTLQRPI